MCQTIPRFRPADEVCDAMSAELVERPEVVVWADRYLGMVYEMDGSLALIPSTTHSASVHSQTWGEGELPVEALVFAQSGSSNSLCGPAAGRRLLAVAGMLMMSTGADDNDIEARDAHSGGLELSLLVRTRHFHSSPYRRAHNCETAGRSHQLELARTRHTYLPGLPVPTAAVLGESSCGSTAAQYSILVQRPGRTGDSLLLSHNPSPWG